MQVLIDTYTKHKTIHHAYVIEGPQEATEAALKHFLQDTLLFKTIGNPDFSHTTHDTFTIEDSRILREQQLRKSLGDRKIFILSVRTITSEAQNALLKVLEEPTEGTHFFIIMPRADSLLPTVRSRVLIITTAQTDTNNSLAEAKKFLTAGLVDRLALVKPIIEEKDKTKAIQLLNDVETLLAADVVKNKQKLETLLQTKKYIQDTASSLKLLLEHIALSV